MRFPKFGNFLSSKLTPKKKKALITGISGQDGSYLAELLLEKDYDVVGTVRFLETEKLWRLERIKDRIKLIKTDLMDPTLVQVLVNQQFDEIYHLAGPSFIPFCWEKPLEISEVIIESAKNILEALVQYDKSPVRFCNASSSEIFGNATELPQNEETPLNPITPYGIAKKQTHIFVQKYREKYNLFSCNAIMFNHESPRRDIKFAMHKITDLAARVKLGRFQGKIPVGNLHTKRDWGFAGDYVEAMWSVLQQKHPDDYVIATGKSYMVRDLIEITFATVGIGNWEDYIEVDQSMLRLKDIEHLCGDYSKAYRKLNWAPKHSFAGLISMMIAEDMKRIKKELAASRS